MVGLCDGYPQVVGPEVKILNKFHDHADRIRMANIAQTVNVLQAMILTGCPSIPASASIPPTPQPTMPRPLIMVVWESVPTRVSG